VLLFQLHLQPLPTTTPLTFTAKSSTTRPTTAPTTTVTTTNGGACHCFASLSQSHETKHPNHNSHGGVVAALRINLLRSTPTSHSIFPLFKHLLVCHFYCLCEIREVSCRCWIQFIILSWKFLLPLIIQQQANLEIMNLCFNVLLFPLSIWISSLRLVCFLGYDPELNEWLS